MNICMNKEANKRGRGRAPKRGGPELGRKAYIQQIIARAESEASSCIAVRQHAKRIKSEGQFIDQPALSTVFLGDSTHQPLPIVEETSSSIPDQGNPMLVIEREEVASRTTIGSGHSSKGKEVVVDGTSHQDAGEGIVGAFVSPRDQGSAVKVTQT